jgi:hypothetical protein
MSALTNTGRSEVLKFPRSNGSFRPRAVTHRSGCPNSALSEVLHRNAFCIAVLQVLEPLAEKATGDEFLALSQEIGQRN